MKENKEKQHVDWLRNFPEGLLFEILLKLPTKVVVRCSVLSSWWRNIWKLVPGLDLDYNDFREQNDLASFIDRFLGFNSECESRLQSFKLSYGPGNYDGAHRFHLTRWINIVVERKVQHLHVLCRRVWDLDLEMEIPQTVYTCESLVSLKLRGVIMPNPNFVSLPSVKGIVLESVFFRTDRVLVMLISGCPLVKSLMLRESLFSSFSFDSPRDSNDLVVASDAPGSLVEVDIAFNLLGDNGFDPDNLPMRNMIRSFLIGISSVKVMKIHPFFLEAIYGNSRWHRLPLFPNLSSLRVQWFDDYTWEMLPIFLERCPNLKHLSLQVFRIFHEKKIGNVTGPQCFLPSLEFVEIKDWTASQDVDEAREMKQVSYFLEKSTILKKLTLSLNPDRKKNASAILNKFLTIPTLSPSCQVVVL